MREKIRQNAMRWSGVKAPDLDDFLVLAEQAFASLPEEMRKMTREVEIRVADFPDEEALKSVGLQNEFDLLGLFSGVGLAHASASGFTGSLPNRIWIYRRPVLDYWAEHEETLGDIVIHVLIHEIGHHFGLSDADIDALEAAVD